MKYIKIKSLILLITFYTSAAESALLSRMEGLAYYDTELNITWLADANLITSNPLSISTNAYALSDGRTQHWFAEYMVEELNEHTYLGQTGWRLPVANPINGVDYNFSAPSGEDDWGTNISAPGTRYAGSTQSEMAHLFYNTLGNTASSGNLANTGPFTSLLDTGYHFTGSSVIRSGAPRDFVFAFSLGAQFYTLHNASSQQGLAWAVHDGDISPIPVPASLWLFFSGISGLFLFTKSKRKKPNK